MRAVAVSPTAWAGAPGAPRQPARPPHDLRRRRDTAWAHHFKDTSSEKEPLHRPRGRPVPKPRDRNQATAFAHPARRIPGPLARYRIIPAPLEPPSAPTPRTGGRRRTPRRLVGADTPRRNAAGHFDSFVGYRKLTVAGEQYLSPPPTNRSEKNALERHRPAPILVEIRESLRVALLAPIAGYPIVVMQLRLVGAVHLSGGIVLGTGLDLRARDAHVHL